MILQFQKAHVLKIQNKEKEYLNKLDVLYEDKFKGVVSEETYKRIASETIIHTPEARRKISSSILTLYVIGK